MLGAAGEPGWREGLVRWGSQRETGRMGPQRTSREAQKLMEEREWVSSCACELIGEPKQHVMRPRQGVGAVSSRQGRVGP